MPVKTHTDSDVIELERTEFKEPNMYKVVFYNDNYTPVQFVMFVLAEIFRKDSHEAETITMQIHNTGSGVAGLFSEEIAEEKRDETIKLARDDGFPLVVEIEEDF